MAAILADWHKVTLNIPFASHKHAVYAKQAIEVDAELQPQAVRRTLEVQDEALIATFSTLTIRLARLTTNAFLENVHLIVRTLEAFGAEAEGKGQKPQLEDMQHNTTT